MLLRLLLPLSIIALRSKRAGVRESVCDERYIGPMTTAHTHTSNAIAHFSHICAHAALNSGAHYISEQQQRSYTSCSASSHASRNIWPSENVSIFIYIFWCCVNFWCTMLCNTSVCAFPVASAHTQPTSIRTESAQQQINFTSIIVTHWNDIISQLIYQFEWDETVSFYYYLHKHDVNVGCFFFRQHTTSILIMHSRSISHGVVNWG